MVGKSLTLLVFASLLLMSTGSKSTLSISRWINLLRYVDKSMTREPVVNHTDHVQYAEHVELVSKSIKNHFFNDILEAVVTDQSHCILSTRFPTDFLILLDSSASIGSENYHTALKTLTMWVDVFEAQSFVDDSVRVSMVSFSEPDKLIHLFPFSPSQNKTDIINNIQSADYHNGRSTSTAQALWLAERLFRADSREGVNRVLLLVTDGWSTVPGPIFGVLWPAARLKHNLDVSLYVMGVGDQINHNELKAVASRPASNHVFEVSNYTMMEDVVQSVQEMYADSLSQQASFGQLCGQ